MATNVVNLDALIGREDLAITGDAAAEARNTMTIRALDLKPDGFFYRVLRKPDFQRETSNWTPEKICELVKSYLNKELVPAIVLWLAGDNVFVIDGAHRLSALIAWVHDDYGDGPTSRLFFDNNIPPEQLRAADRTRKLVAKEIGGFAEHEIAITRPDHSNPDVVNRISGDHPGSLGLHPALYFYGQSSNYQPSAFLGAASFVKWLDESHKLMQFAENRERFENFLLGNKHIVTQVLRFGTGKRNVNWMNLFYQRLLTLVADYKTDAEALHHLTTNSTLPFVLQKDALPIRPEGTKRGKFSRNTKSAIYLAEALAHPHRCKVCRGLLHCNSMNVDHIDRHEDGGSGDFANGQMTHPYCTSTYKETQVRREKEKQFA